MAIKMINRVLKNGVMTLAAAMCLLPASGFAATISFSLGGFSVASNPAYSGGILTIDYNDLTTTAGTCNSGCSGTYVETYNNSSGAFELAQTGGNAIDLTYNAGAGLVSTNGIAFSLYTAATALNFNAAFLSEIGLANNPPAAAVPVALQAVSAAVQSNDKVTSPNTSMTITPEPSTFAMLGLALLCGIVYTVRRRSLTNISQ
jgi:hypothetical protein